MASSKHRHRPEPSGGIVQSGGTPDQAPLNFDDDEIYSGRSKKRDGGTTQERGGDSGKLGPPAEQLSDTNGPSDPAHGGPGRKA
jgi:hypothetical protein